MTCSRGEILFCIECGYFLVRKLEIARKIVWGVYSTCFQINSSFTPLEDSMPRSKEIQGDARHRRGSRRVRSQRQVARKFFCRHGGSSIVRLLLLGS